MNFQRSAWWDDHCHTPTLSVQSSLSFQTGNLQKLRRSLIVSRSQETPPSISRCSNLHASSRRHVLSAVTLGAWSLYDSWGRSKLGADATAAPSLQTSEADKPPAKLTGLSPEQLADRIRDDFVNKQYYVTGNLSSEIFADNCLFTDPTIKVYGWKFYTDAVKTLFDADKSRADLISLDVLDDGIVQLKWRLEGVIKPWPGYPSIKPYTGVTRYIQDSDGSIAKHLETWDTSIIDVFVSVFWKGFGAPAAAPVTG